DRVEALLDAGDVFLRHRTADDLRLELEATALTGRRDVELDASELARAAALLLVRVVDRRRTADRLAIGNLRRTDADIDLVGPLQDVDLDIEMQFAHPLQDGLAALLV